MLEMRVDEQDSDEDEQREDGVEGVREAEWEDIEINLGILAKNLQDRRGH